MAVISPIESTNKALEIVFDTLGQTNKSYQQSYRTRRIDVRYNQW